jgi:hypothetical protein
MAAATYVRMLELYGSWKMEKDTLTFFCLVVSATSSLIRYREHASMKHSLGTATAAFQSPSECHKHTYT